MSRHHFVTFLLLPLLTLSSTVPSDFQPVILCEEIICPEVNCQDPVRSGNNCCPQCPEIVDASVVNCVHGEMLIKHGETFHPSSNNSCRECRCSNGTIECKDLSAECPAFECDSDHTVIPEGNCCPVCSSNPKSQEVCTVLDGRTFHNGEWWHPSLPPYGLVPCINCTCVDSTSECVRLPCPSQPLPLCAPDEPVEEVTLCCRKCIRVPTTTVPTDAPVTRELPSTISPPIIIPSPHQNCMPEARTVGVWLHQTEDTVALVLTKEVNKSLEIYSWRDINGTYSRENESVDLLMETIDHHFPSEEHVFKGWALTRRLNGLSSKGKKRRALEMCTSECARLVVHYLRPVLFDLGCEQ